MITKNAAIKLMIGLLFVVLVFHFCILFEIISYEIVWSGRINSLNEMRVFESVSILINIFLIVTLFVKSKNIQNNVSNKVVNGIIWAFVFIFSLNTIGNLFAKSKVELIFGTVLTLVSSILCWIIVRKSN